MLFSMFRLKVSLASKLAFFSKEPFLVIWRGAIFSGEKSCFI